MLAKAYNNRGNHYTRNGEYDRAIQDYDQSIKINPNYPKAFNNRGVAYQKKGEYERATKDFDEAYKARARLLYRIRKSRRNLPKNGRVRPCGRGL